MKIGLNPGIAVPENNLQATSGSRAPAAARVGEESRFTSAESSVNALSASVLAAPELRLERIEALRAQIAEGTYPVSSQQIAASILEQLRAH